MHFLRVLVRWRTEATLLAAAVSIAACSTVAALNAITDPKDRAFALEAMERLQACDADYLRDVTEPGLRARVGLLVPRMCAIVPKGSDAKFRLVDATSMSKLGEGGFRRSQLIYEVDEGRTHALIRVGVQRTGSTMALTDLYVGSLPKPIEEMTALNLVGKSPVQYLFLGLAAAMVCLSILAFVLVIVTKEVRRKWLWAIGCLLGFGQFAVNWSTGAVGFQLLTVQGLSAVVRKPHMSGPWEVGFAIPVFAILFLIQRRDLQFAARPRKPQLNL